MPRRLILHVGCSKSGTSALQYGLRAAREHLASVGVGLAFPLRPQAKRGLLQPLGWRAETGFTDPPDPDRVRRIARHLRATPGDVVLVTNEDLAELDAGRIDLLADVFADVDLEVQPVVSARSWAKQLPSEYQQLLKVRLTLTYAEFLDGVRDRSGASAERFRARQDVADIATRWGAVSASGLVDVVSVPSFAADPDGVFRMFGELVGFDPAQVPRPGDDFNRAYGVVEVEMLRRVNAATAGLSSYEDEYAPIVRQQVFAATRRVNSARLTLPPEHLDWVHAEGETQLAAVRAAGYRLHGDVDRLVADDGDAAPMPTLDEDAVAAAAVRSLVRLAKVAGRSVGGPP